MGIVIITFLVSLAVYIGSIFLLNYLIRKCLSDEWKGVTTIAVITVSGFISVISLIAFINFMMDYLPRNVKQTNAQIESQRLERLLVENYDPDNLKNALVFNVLQKQSTEYNRSWLWYCWENCYVVDTIAIPNGKYMPSNMVKLDAVIDRLTHGDSTKVKD